MHLLDSCVEQHGLLGDHTNVVAKEFDVDLVYLDAVYGDLELEVRELPMKTA